MPTTATEPPDTLEVETETVACDGTGGTNGHPRVYLNLQGLGAIDCPYCGRRFVLKGGRAGGH